MPLPKAPVDYLFVTLDKAFQDEIITESGVKLYKSTWFNAEWHVTVTGKVVSIPNKLSQLYELRTIVPEAEVGDTIVFSYKVVNDGELRDRDTQTHKNLFYHEGEYYWKVRYDFVLGYIRYGEIIPSSGYVFLEAIEKTEKVSAGGIIIPEMTAKGKYLDKAKVVAVGIPAKNEPTLNISAGDTVRIDQRMVHKYRVLDKDYLILSRKHILSKKATIMNIQPMHDRVVVQVKEREQKTASGIILPSTSNVRYRHAVVLAVGSGTKDDPVTVKVDDNVLIPPAAGVEIDVDGIKAVILRESEILAIV